MTSSAASRLGGGFRGRHAEVGAEGLAVFDADWTITSINEPGAALLGRSAATLVGRNIWGALPELTGTIFHSFLLHARTSGTLVTWRGYYPATERWLHATAVVDGGLLQVSFRESAERPAGDGPPEPGQDERADDGRLRFLAEVSEAMISTLDTGESADRLAQLVVPRLGDWAVVSILGEGGHPEEEAFAHRDPEGERDVRTYLGGVLRGSNDEESPLAVAFMSGAPVHLSPLDPALVAPSLTSDEVRAAWRRLDVTSCTIVPLRARSETFGALSFMNCGDRPPHTEMEIATAVEVARRGALALDNARLYGRQLKVAETLQRSLLSPPPQPDDLELAVRYRPATTHMHVGGDWYDAFQQEDGATLLVIGDVVGHNVDAAAAMGQLRSIVRAIAYDHSDDPAQTLARVERVLTGLHLDTLATALVARIEQPAELAAQGLRTLRWSSAGHLPPVLLQPDGSVETLWSVPERLLGADPPGPRTDQVAVLRPGGTLLLYTDGLVEHGRTGIDEGIARLTGVLAEVAALPVDEMCDRLLTRIGTGRTDDDIALLAVRFHPQGAATRGNQEPAGPGASK